jgi:protein-tyrosine phosphatase
MIQSAFEENQSIASRSLTTRVLFLCTGNYYRSRFAEELFNHHASSGLQPWQAFSLGFNPHPDVNPGSMSVFAHGALAARKINPVGATRMPVAVRNEDFTQYDYCIALSETEHRPMMRTLFPQHVSRVRFWQIEDLAWEAPERAMAGVETEVSQLLKEIQQKSTTRRI